MRQIILAKGHEIKRWSIVSSWSQKQHLVHPCQFLLTRLYFVRMTFLTANHMTILIFRGQDAKGPVRADPIIGPLDLWKKCQVQVRPSPLAIGSGGTPRFGPLLCTTKSAHASTKADERKIGGWRHWMWKNFRRRQGTACSARSGCSPATSTQKPVDFPVS
jgi:hypothetical protein